MSFTIRPITVDTYDQIVRETGELWYSRANLELLRRKCGPTTKLLQLAAVTPVGRLVGFGLAATGQWDPMLKEGQFELRIRVEEAWQGRGVGSALYAELERFARENGAVRLTGCTGDDAEAALAWAGRRGFAVSQHVYPSRLDLAGFDPAPFASVVERAEAAGFRFTSLAEYPRTDETFARFYGLYLELAEDVPGMSGLAWPKPEEMQAMFGDDWKPDNVILAEQRGEWAAMAFLLHRPGNSYYNNMTGVRRPFRGHGLGLAAKLKAIEYARSQGGVSMRTHNDSTNQHILAINQQLGFQPEPGIYWLNRTL